MLIINSKGNKAKYKYVVLHYNEIFLNDTLKMLHNNGLQLCDAIPYSINVPYDYFMFKCTGEIKSPDTALISQLECVYSKIKFIDIIREYDEFIQTKCFDREILNNVFFNGGL